MYAKQTKSKISLHWLGKFKKNEENKSTLKSGSYESPASYQSLALLELCYFSLLGRPDLG